MGEGTSRAQAACPGQGDLLNTSEESGKGAKEM